MIECIKYRPTSRTSANHPVHFPPSTYAITAFPFNVTFDMSITNNWPASSPTEQTLPNSTNTQSDSAAPSNVNHSAPQHTASIGPDAETPSLLVAATNALMPSKRVELDATVFQSPKAANRKYKNITAVRENGFTSAETEAMIGTVEKLLPLCRDEWEAVLAEHNKLFRDQMKTVDSLKRKFATLHRKKMPTGDPLMPEEVRKAKHIRYKMTERADLGCGDEESDLMTGIGNSSGDEIGETCSSREPSPLAVSTESSDEVAPSVVTPSLSATPTSLPLPRPLIAKRKDVSSQSFRVDDILNMMKMNMMQEQQRREEELRRREEEKIIREEERREERQRREHESKRQERYFEALLMMMASSPKQDNGKKQ